MKIKGVCFDLDQTICNSEDYMYVFSSDKNNFKNTAEWQVYQFLKPHLKIVDWKQFIEIYSQARKETASLIPNTASSHSRYLYIQKTLEKLNMRFKPNLIYQATNIYWNYIIKNMTLYPNVKNVLEKIKENNLLISIVTDLTADIQNKKLLKLQIEGYIDFLITSEEAGVDKPNKKVMELTLKKMNLNPNETIFVGNNPKTDIQVAHNIKSESILFDFNKKYIEKKTQNSPTFYTNNFNEILSFLNIKEKKYSNKKLLIFDMIGVLTNESFLIKSMFQKLNPNIDIDKVQKHYDDYKINKINNKEFWENIGFKNNFVDFEKKLINEIKFRKNTIKVLKELKEKNELALLSNIPKEWGEMILKKYNLEKYFTEIIFSGNVGMKKPDIGIYKLLLKKFSNIKPSNIYFIDDQLKNLSVGKKMLMQSIFFKNKDEKNINYIPDYVINNLGDIKNIILKKKI